MKKERVVENALNKIKSLDFVLCKKHNRKYMLGTECPVCKQEKESKKE